MGSPTSGTPDKKQGQTQPQPQTQSGDNPVPAAPANVQLPSQTMQKLEIATPAAQFIEQDVGAAIEAAVRGQGGTAPTCASLGQFVSTGSEGMTITVVDVTDVVPMEVQNLQSTLGPNSLGNSVPQDIGISFGDVQNPAGLAPQNPGNDSQ